MKSGKKLEKKSKKTLKKKKLSSNITTIILILIFLVGLSVMLYPTVSNYINQRHQSKAIAAYDEKVSEMKPEDYTKYFEAAETVRTVLFLPTVVCRAQSFLQTSIKWK